jgi:hypothetical protein
MNEASPRMRGTSDAPSSVRLEPGVDEMHLPVGAVIEGPPHHRARLEIDAETAGDARKFDEEPLD